MKNSAPWILWLVFTTSLVLSTRNPVYLLAATLCMLILGFFIARQKGNLFWLRGNLQFLLSMILISAVVNALFVHTGSSVLMSLPNNWLLIGGNITLEGLIYGVINGLVIGSLYLAFNILNMALSIKQMTRLIPAALRPIAMTVTVALTFFPSVQTRAREIKEAQMIRGNAMKRVVDWLPLIIPLLVTSLEKAFLLAESMTSRGFYVRKPTMKIEILLIGMVLGVFLIFSGWILSLYDYSQVISVLMYSAGGLALILVFWSAQRSEKTTRYQKETWTLTDILLSALFGLAAIGLFTFRASPLLSSFQFSPYPTLENPHIQLAGIGVAFLPLIPVVWFLHD